jgi:DNA-binding XRE family transcriptional regulator
MPRLYEPARAKSATHVRTFGLASMFVMCEHSGMKIAEYREAKGLTLEELAGALALKSKGYMSEIERANRCSPKIALALEAHSSGLIDAATLNEDVALVRRAAA